MTQLKEAAGGRLGRAHKRILGIIAADGARSTVEDHDAPAEVTSERRSSPPLHAVETENPVSEQPAKAPSLTLAVVVGALSGALMAVVTYYVLSELSPLQDSRVAAIAKRVVGVEQAVEQQGRTVRGTEVDVARLVDENAGISQRFEAQAAKTEQAFAAIDEARGELKAAISGPGSPMFGIAVAQLGQALSEGRRFETEWVNLFTLAGDDPALRVTLATLMPVSAAGVATPAQLRELLANLASAEKVPTGSLSNPLQFGLLMLQTRLGVPVGYSPEATVAAKLLDEADDHLARADVRSALAILAGLPAPQAAALAPWLDAARRHERAHSAYEALTARTRDRLRQPMQVNGNR